MADFPAKWALLAGKANRQNVYERPEITQRAVFLLPTERRFAFCFDVLEFVIWLMRVSPDCDGRSGL
jgi:hypothetical protein